MFSCTHTSLVWAFKTYIVWHISMVSSNFHYFNVNVIIKTVKLVN